MVGKFRLLGCFVAAFLAGCASSTHSLVKGPVWMQQDMQPITPQTLLIVDVSQNVFAPIEVQMTQERRQKQAENLGKSAESVPMDFDQRKHLAASQKQDALMDYLDLNQRHLRLMLLRRLKENGMNVLAVEEFEKAPFLFAQRPLLRLKVNFLTAKSGKKDPHYIAAGLGAHQLLTEVKLLDERQSPVKECLKFEINVDGWKPGVAIASKWNPLAHGVLSMQTPDADKTVQEMTPIIVEYFVNQHWLQSSLAPDYPPNQRQNESFFHKIFFWQQR